MKLINQAKFSKKTKKLFFREVSRFKGQSNYFSSFDIKQLAERLSLSIETGLQYAKEWRRNHPEMMVLPISQRAYLSPQAYKKFKATRGNKKAYALHYSMTIPKNNFHFLEKCTSLRYDRNNNPYLWIDERKYFARDKTVNARNFLKVTKKFLDTEIRRHKKLVHMMSSKMSEILDKGVKPRKENVIVDLALKSWKQINRIIKDTKKGDGGDFEPIRINCTPYIYKLYTQPFTFYKSNILKLKKFQPFNRKMTKEEIKAVYWDRYWEKRNKASYNQRVKEDFNALTDCLKYQIGHFETSKLHKTILQRHSVYYKENEGLFLNMYKKFRYNKYGIKKNRAIDLKIELEMIRSWKDSFKSGG